MQATWRSSRLGLYSRRDVDEYWIVYWLQRLVSVYRRDGGKLVLLQTVKADESLTTPLLPEFHLPIADLFWSMPVYVPDRAVY